MAAFVAMIEAELDSGMAVASIINLGHTGRHGAFAELATEAGMMSVLIGYGENGPFVMDLATSMVAGD